MKEIVVIRGGGDLATGIAYRLFKVGYKIVMTEIDNPLAIRRKVSFSEAIYDGEAVVEGVKSVNCKNIEEVYTSLKKGCIPITVDRNGLVIDQIKPLVVVDAIMAKKNIGTSIRMAPLTIGIGPGFCAGKDIDLVVESNRGQNLGKVIYNGYAEKHTGIPGDIMGYREKRLIKSPCSGNVRSFFQIGDLVQQGDIVGRVGEETIIAQITGVLRGIIREEVRVSKGMKIGDIDPRGMVDYAFTISDKARAISGGVLEGIEYMKMKRRTCNG